MITKAVLVLDERQSAFIADAILVLAGIIQQNPEVYREAARTAAAAMFGGCYDMKTVTECVDMTAKLADKWDPPNG